MQEHSLWYTIAEFFIAHVDFVTGVLAGSMLRASVKPPPNIFSGIAMVLTGLSMALLFSTYLTDGLGVSVIVAVGLLAMVGEEFARRIISRAQTIDLPGPLNKLLGPSELAEEEVVKPKPVRKKRTTQHVRKPKR